MHGAQHRIPHQSRCFQQLRAVDSMPFALEGRFSLTLVVSIWYLPLVHRS